MGLLDGGLASVFSGIMGSFYMDATLHRLNSDGDDGMGGGSNEAFFPDEPVKAQLDQTTWAQQSDGGFTDRDQRILVLANGVAQITPADEITVKGIRWQIASVTQDPCGAYYDLRGRLSGYVADTTPVEGGALDFTDPNNSGLLALFMEAA